MELLDAALEQVRPYVEHAIRNNEYGDLYHAPGERHHPEGYTVARLRLDWELSLDSIKEEPVLTEHVAGLMLAGFEEDLEDMIIDGDVMHTSDPLLKTIDGAKKRGKEPVEVKFTSFHLYRETNKKRKTVEFTVYCLLAIKWEE